MTAGYGVTQHVFFFSIYIFQTQIIFHTCENLITDIWNVINRYYPQVSILNCKIFLIFCSLNLAIQEDIISATKGIHIQLFLTSDAHGETSADSTDSNRVQMHRNCNGCMCPNFKKF